MMSRDPLTIDIALLIKQTLCNNDIIQPFVAVELSKKWSLTPTQNSTTIAAGTVGRQGARTLYHH